LTGIIEKLEKQIDTLHEKMAAPSFYKQPSEQIAKSNAELESLDKKLANAYERWETLAEIEG
jgi:ATP-binding cassette subfamily F protein uup